MTWSKDGFGSDVEIKINFIAVVYDMDPVWRSEDEWIPMIPGEILLRVKKHSVAIFVSIDCKIGISFQKCIHAIYVIIMTMSN